MSAITNHASESLLAAYASGSLPQAFSMVVAAHISLCLECRARFEAHHAVGGAILEGSQGATLSSGLKSSVMSQLGSPFVSEPGFKRYGVFPGPVMAALKGKPPSWKSLGLGIRQSILLDDASGSARLLFIPPGSAVPDHSHGGMELTLVLQGSFSDESGSFGVGDLEVADESLEHTPVAGANLPCICLAATDAPLRFNSIMPRLLQSWFRI